MRRPFIGLAGFLVLSFSSSALAVVFVVNSPADADDASTDDNVCETSSPGVCTLRAAVEQANTMSGVTIQLPPYEINLSLGALFIDPHVSVSIVGAGMDLSVVSAGGVSRILDVDDSATVFISDMTLRDGHSSEGGGAIFAYSNVYLIVERCRFLHNDALYGGAIQTDAGGNLQMTDSVVTDAHATMGSGGALAIYEATLKNTTINGNTATMLGGGILVEGTVNLINCTVSGNTASGGTGGGIAVGGTLGLYNVTIKGNLSVGASGGGVANEGFAVTLVNTIVSGNNRKQKTSFIADDCAGPLTSGGNNIVTAVPVACTVTGSYSAVGAMLGPLQDNGGHVPTHAPLTGSPAIDAGAAGGCTTVGGGPLTTDARGVHRPIGLACDMGAYERAPCGDADGDGTVDVGDVFFVINFLFAGGPVPPGLANVNGDVVLDVGDVFYLINALFAEGPAPTCSGT